MAVRVLEVSARCAVCGVRPCGWRENNWATYRLWQGQSARTDKEGAGAVNCILDSTSSEVGVRGQDTGE